MLTHENYVANHYLIFNVILCSFSRCSGTYVITATIRVQILAGAVKLCPLDVLSAVLPSICSLYGSVLLLCCQVKGSLEGVFCSHVLVVTLASGNFY